MKKMLIPLLAISCAWLACTTTRTVVVHDGPPPQPVTYSPPPQNAPVNPPPAEYYTSPTQQTGDYQQFYDELSPYGNWFDYPGLGYVWQPAVDADFQPYSTNGHWVMSDEGWTWVSDYPWGWAAFHYGRWVYEDGYGWLWLPGTEWAPAWVTWGHSGGYYGWAPLAPNIAANTNWAPPQHAWVFVPQQHMAQPDVHNYVVNKTNNITIVQNVTIINNIHNNNTVVYNNNNNTNVTNNNNTTIVNNHNTTINNNNTTTNNNNTTINNTNITNNNIHNRAVYNMGPQVTEVERVTNTRIPVAHIAENNRPAKAEVNNNTLVMYRPVVKEVSKTQQKPAPQNVAHYQPKPPTVQNNPGGTTIGQQKPAIITAKPQLDTVNAQRAAFAPPVIKPVRDTTSVKRGRPVAPIIKPRADTVVVQKPAAKPPVFIRQRDTVAIQKPKPVAPVTTPRPNPIVVQQPKIVTPVVKAKRDSIVGQRPRITTPVVKPRLDTAGIKRVKPVRQVIRPKADTTAAKPPTP